MVPPVRLLVVTTGCLRQAVEVIAAEGPFHAAHAPAVGKEPARDQENREKIPSFIDYNAHA
jgi:hypothetical protein